MRRILSAHQLHANNRPTMSHKRLLLSTETLQRQTPVPCFRMDGSHLLCARVMLCSDRRLLLSGQYVLCTADVLPGENQQLRNDGKSLL